MRTSRLLSCAIAVCALALISALPAWAGERPDADDVGPPPAPAPLFQEEAPVVAAPPALPALPAPPALPALPAAPALPLDDEPPAPPAPPAPPMPPEGDVVPFPETDEVPLPGDVVPADEFVLPPEGTLVRVPCGPAPCPEPCAPDCCWQRGPCGRPLDDCGRPIGFWDVTIEAIGTDLEDPDGAVGPARAGSLTWGAHDYDPEFGGRVTIGYAVNRTDRLEFRGSWSGIHRDASTQVGVFGFSPPVGGTSPTVNATMRSRAELFGGEASWWRELCCRGSWRLLGALGYRFISFDESATLNGALAAAPFTAAFVHATSEHEFHLGQVSVAVEKQLGQRFEVGLSGKGLLGAVTRDIRVNDTNMLAGGAHAARSDDSEFTWGGEFELTLRYKLSARVALTAGYTLLYLDGVVRASDGMDFTQAATGVVQVRQAADSMLVQSVFAGFRFRL